MKTYFIRNSKEISRDFRHGLSEFLATGDDDMQISDGYHTMDELYDHRIALFMALCRAVNGYKRVWKSKLHADGSNYAGWFILGINDSGGEQITYHLPLSLWDDCKFHELERAPKFDGHTSADVLERLKKL